MRGRLRAWLRRMITYRWARRIVVAMIGGTILLIGIAMVILPGPAIIVIPVGLGILNAVLNQAGYPSKVGNFSRFPSERLARVLETELELAHAAYHSTWYLPAIRELALDEGPQLLSGLADELAQARETRLWFEGLAGRMVHVPGARHALDDVLAMLGDVHLHATANAHASRTL